MANTVLPWSQYTEAVVGLNHPTLADVDNRSLRAMLGRSGFQVDQVFGGLALGSNSINAGSSDYTGTAPVRITAAIADCVAQGKPYCFVPTKAWDGTVMLPYNASLVTFNTSVKMTREGGNPQYFDVMAYGAKGDGIQDDTVAVRQAITSARVAGSLQGGVVYVPSGTYFCTGTIQIPVNLNQNQVILQGEGMNVSRIYFSGPSTNFTAAPTFPVCLLNGTTTPDAAGANAQQTQYCGLKDIRIDCGGVTTGKVVGLQFCETQNCFATNVIVSNVPNSGYGLYVRGATISGGIGSSSNVGAARLNAFHNVVIAAIGSGASSTPSAVVFQNADENDFYNCSFGCTQGLTPGQDTIFTSWIQSGRNNRFFGVLYTGDRSSVKTNYVAIVFGPPTDENGVANGVVTQNQDYGAVYEGFDIGVWHKSDNTGNTTANQIYGVNPSIVNKNFQDDNAAFGGGFVDGKSSGFIFDCPLLGVRYAAVSPISSPTCALANSATPSVSGSDTWATNGATITITKFLGATVGLQPAPLDGQKMVIRAADNNTTLGDANNHAGGNIFLWGRRDLTLQTSWQIELRYFAGPAGWFQIAPVVRATLNGDSSAVSVSAGGNTTPDLSAFTAFEYTCAGNITINNPINVVAGKLWSAEVFNNSVGAITITLGGNFRAAGVTAPAAAKRRCLYFQNKQDGTSVLVAESPADI